MVGQIVNGKVYDAKTTAKSVKVANTNNKIIAYTDDYGDFSIKASINDTLVFSSLFYIKKTIVLTKPHFDEVFIIQLKKTINKLDEVLLTEEPKFKEFSAEEYNTSFNLQLENDRKNRPYLYNSYTSGGVDFVAIAKLIGKLFKKKRPDPIRYVTYKELDSFFNNNDYFNSKLLHNELEISEAHRFLFFDYCEARTIENKMLSGNQLILLDAFMTYSADFLRIINEYKE